MRAAGALWWLWAWARVDGLPAADAGALSDGHRAAVQQVHAAGRRARRASASRRCSRAAVSQRRACSSWTARRRSGHGNAYFTGFGTRASASCSSTRCSSRLAPDEIEAVLAHELGHFKLRHVVKRIAWSAVAVARDPGAARVARAASPGSTPASAFPKRMLAGAHGAPRRRARAVPARAAGVHVRAGAAVVAVFAPARVRGRRVRRARTPPPRR